MTLLPPPLNRTIFSPQSSIIHSMLKHPPHYPSRTGFSSVTLFPPLLLSAPLLQYNRTTTLFQTCDGGVSRRASPQGLNVSRDTKWPTPGAVIRTTHVIGFNSSFYDETETNNLIFLFLVFHHFLFSKENVTVFRPTRKIHGTKSIYVCFWLSHYLPVFNRFCFSLNIFRFRRLYMTLMCHVLYSPSRKTHISRIRYPCAPLFLHSLYFVDFHTQYAGAI